MRVVKIFGILLLSFVFSFSMWYLIFWFVSAESNLFIWGPWTKVFYMFFGLMLSNKILKETTK